VGFWCSAAFEDRDGARGLFEAHDSAAVLDQAAPGVADLPITRLAA
jgi:hypothetical protein